MRRAVALVIGTVAAVALLARARKSASSARLAAYAETLQPAGDASSGLRAQFFGATTLVISDGKNSIMVDGFLSRPSMVRELILSGTEPNEDRIDAALSEGRIGNLQALLVAHSHFDHAMDAPRVAKKTGALLIGSESTRNIARGENFDEKRFHLIQNRVPLTIGDFEVNFFESPHARAHKKIMEFRGSITQPLRTPARLWDYKSDVNYTFLIRHSAGTLLVVPSANIPLGLGDAKADVVFLSIGHLSLQVDKKPGLLDYWKEAVTNTGAKLVIPVHWDNLMGALEEPLSIPPKFLDDVTRSMSALHALAKGDDIKLAMMPLFKPVALP